MHIDIYKSLLGCLMRKNLYAPRQLLASPGLRDALFSISLLLAGRIFKCFLLKNTTVLSGYVVLQTGAVMLLTWLLSRIVFIQSEESPKPF